MTMGLVIGLIPFFGLCGLLLSSYFPLFPLTLLSLLPCSILGFFFTVPAYILTGEKGWDWINLSMILHSVNFLLGVPALALVYVIVAA